MPNCSKCGKPVTCHHCGPATDGVALPCGKSSGGIWVHVVEETSFAGVPKVSVQVAGSEQTTDAQGFARQDPVALDEHQVELLPFPDASELARRYDRPLAATKMVRIQEPEVVYVEFRLVRRAELKVVVATKDDTQRFEDAEVVLSGGIDRTVRTNADGVADFGDLSAGTYHFEVTLSTADGETFCLDPARREQQLAPGDEATVRFEPVARASPRFVVTCGGEPLADVELKLRRQGGEPIVVGNTGPDGRVTPNPGLPPGEYTILPTVEETTHYFPGATVTLTAGFAEDVPVVVQALAHPVLRAVEHGTGKVLEGVELRLAGGEGRPQLDLAKTSANGSSPTPAGLPPGQYAVTVVESSFDATLFEPNLSVQFAEGGREVIDVALRVPNGALAVHINRYDGQPLAGRVTIDVALRSDPGTILHTVTTAARTRRVDREGDRDVEVREDFVEVPRLKPGTYRVCIRNLQAGVLDAQLPAGKPWTMGPDETGQLDLIVARGETARAEFTLSRYKKVQFLGYNVLPGFGDSYRCSKCNKASSAEGNCSNPSCEDEELSSHRCPSCQKLYVGEGTCPDCPSLCLWRAAGSTEWHLPGEPLGTATYEASGCVTCKGVFVAGVDAPCPSGCGRKLEPERNYLGLADEREDLLARCLLMKAAILKAKDHHDTDADVLKVFVAPEFYFRGRTGAYPIEDLSLITDELRKTTSLPEYSDWMFVFGSAIGCLPLDSSEAYELEVAASVVNSASVELRHGARDRVEVCEKLPANQGQLPPPKRWKLRVGTAEPVPTRRATRLPNGNFQLTLTSAVTADEGDTVRLLEPEGMEIFNVALLQKGGPDEGVGSFREGLVYKEKVSHIDFLRRRDLNWAHPAGRPAFIGDGESLILPTEGADELLSRRRNPRSGERNNTGIGGGVLFVVDGVSIGLELCLDHAAKRLSKYYETAAPGTPHAQVHLIPSWGMSIVDASLPGPAGTQIFNVDGPQGSHAATVVVAAGTTTTTNIGGAQSFTVEPPDPEDLTYKDSTQRPPADVTLTVTPSYDAQLESKRHRVNRAATDKGEGHCWVDVYPPSDLPSATTV